MLLLFLFLLFSSVKQGAAVAAGAGAGWWELERAREDGERGESFRPKTSQQEREKNRQLWHKHLKKTMP
jgi:glycerol kinase